MIRPFGDGVLMVKVEVPQGAASLVLAPGVTFLQEEESVFEAMVQGWSAQMLSLIHI